MRTSALIAVVALGCAAGTSPAPAPASVPPATAVAAVVHAPHSHVIKTVAVADGGDAALSADAAGELRLWPALDGTHEPVVVPGLADRQVAVGKTTVGFVAAVLDPSGGAAILDLTADGATRGYHTLANDPACDEVRVVGEGVLLRRRDETIEWRDATGALRARLVPPYGEHVLAISTRRGRALAMLGATKLRWIELGDGGLRWGAAIELPRPVVPPIGIAPNGRRLIAMQPNGLAALIDLPEVALRTLEGSPAVATTSGSTLGFLDDDHAIWGAGLTVGMWSAAGPAKIELQTETALVDRDVGDGVVVAGHGVALELRARDTTRYLGYGLLASEITVAPRDKRALIAKGLRVVVVDPALHADGVLAAGTRDNMVRQGVPIDDQHVLYAAQMGDRIIVGILDLRQPYTTVWAPQVLLGKYDAASKLTYAVDPHIIAFVGNGEIQRFHLDLTTWTVHDLGALPFSGGDFAALDPARADGVILVSAGTLGNGKSRIMTFKDTHSRIPASIFDLDYKVLYVDRDGVAYTASGTKLVALRGGKDVWEATTQLAAEAGAPSARGDLFAYAGAGQIGMIDRAGKERWRVPVWKATRISWLDGDRTILVTTEGGLVALDARTGERRGTGCAWGFGLYDQPPAEQSFTTANQCQEPV